MRPGPNQVGPFGLLQTLADGLKGMLKEDILPRTADKVVFFFAPTISAICALTALSVIPFGPMVSIFGHQTPLQVTDVPVAVLVVLACSSMGVYGIVLGGWASGSTYPLLGGLRSVGPDDLVRGRDGSVHRGRLHDRRHDVDLAASSPPRPATAPVSGPSSAGTRPRPAGTRSCCCPASSSSSSPRSVRPTGRRSTCPRRRRELVAGYMTEYSSIKFAALHALRVRRHGHHVGASTVTLFLGGWRAPVADHRFWSGANSGWWPLLWFFAQGACCCCSSSSGCGPRCPGCATTSSCASAGRCCCRSTWSGSCSWPACGSTSDGRVAAAPGWLVIGGGRRDRAAGRAALAEPARPEPTPTLAGAGRRPAARAASRCRRWTCRYRRARAPSAWSPSGEPANVAAGSGLREGGADVGAITDSVKGFGVTFSHMFRKVVTTEYPFEHAGRGAALPRPAHPQPAPGRAGEVHRLRAVRLGLPGRRDLRRGWRQHRGAALLAG